MDRLLAHTKLKFTAIILAVILFIVSITWITLEVFNTRQIAVPADVSYVHSTAEGNEALGAYIEDQKDYEAHFVSFATAVKEQDANDLTRALAVVSVTVVLGGIILALIVSKWLMKPVKEAYDSQERFIQDAAHELRNPLAAMTIALQNAGPTKQKDPLVRTFKRQTKRLISINEDLLFLERRSKQDPEKIELNGLLEEITEELKPMAVKKNISLSVDSSGEIYKVIAVGDYVRLVKNVIDNAIKYTNESGFVSVAQHKNKNDIIIVVKDNGIGIPQKDTSSVGSRFFRASNTGSIDGTGLGLAIVQKILNVYGGKMSITSKVNKGTTVTITLPA